MTTAYRSIDYKSARKKFQPTAFGAIKVIADTYPLSLDIIYPSIPFTIAVTVISEKPARIPKQLVDTCEVRVYGSSEVTAIFLATRLEELPI